jgi:hypothetical protein
MMTGILIDALREVSGQRGLKERQIALPALLSVSITALPLGAESPPAISCWGAAAAARRPEGSRLPRWRGSMSCDLSRRVPVD